jgi:hypothetical protein
MLTMLTTARMGNMRIIISMVLMALLIAPALGELNEQQKIYFTGIDKGYQMGFLAALGNTNATAAQAYNDLAKGYNDALNLTLSPGDARLEWLAMMPIPQKIEMKLPPVFYAGNVWDGTRVAQMLGTKDLSTMSAPEGRPGLNVSKSNGEIVHKIDGSFGNAKKTGGYPEPDENGRIHGMPADAYYSWYPNQDQLDKIEAGENPSLDPA